MDDRIAELWCVDMTVQKIAAEIGMTSNEVGYRVRKMQEQREIPSAKPRWTEQQLDRLREMVGLGVDVGVIAVTLGRPTHGVLAKVKRLNIRRA